MRPEVLEGTEEARLTYLGATSGLEVAEGPYLVIDVGGGSTELVGGGSANTAAVSLEMGCVRVSERFFAHDPPLAAELDSARRYVRRLVAGALADEPGLSGAARLVGVAGTVSALVRLELGLVGYDRERIHHARLRRSVVEALLSELEAVAASKRRERPELETERGGGDRGGHGGSRRSDGDPGLR